MSSRKSKYGERPQDIIHLLQKEIRELTRRVDNLSRKPVIPTALESRDLLIDELVNASSAVNLSGAAATISNVNVNLPAGWNSMIVLIVGKVQVNNTIATDLRVAAWLALVDDTEINQRGAVSLIATGAYAGEPGTIPLTGVLSVTATTAVRIVGVITGGSTTSGNATATARHLTAIRVRTS